MKAQCARTARCATRAVAADARRARRGNGVGVGLRMANALFGSPSVRRANGGAETSMVPVRLRSTSWHARRAQTPVYEVELQGRSAFERLPRIWVTEPVYDARTGKLVGRDYVGCYPHDADAGGWRALELADRYLGEAQGYDSSDGRVSCMLRAECFRAAEILLLHAASRGNDEAWMKLASLYERDLCEGRYWKGALEGRARHALDVPLDERAAACLAQAASRGHAEALLRLGDLVASAGDSSALARSYGMFRRSFDAACSFLEDHCACAGMAALRLGRCHELGRGCSFSFKKAQAWYRIAAEYLGEAYESGEWKCKRALGEARMGVRRMAQEMNGGY